MTGRDGQITPSEVETPPKIRRSRCDLTGFAGESLAS